MKNINELLEALYKESENKDEVIEYVDLLTDYYAKQRELEILQDKIENIFNDINHAIFNDEHVDLQHLYIDGSKFEANANKYTWVWKKATEKFRYKLYEKITAEIEEINAEIAWSGVQITTNPEYVPDYLNEIVEQLVLLWELDSST